jgi:hypothetical protein
MVISVLVALVFSECGLFFTCQESKSEASIDTAQGSLNEAYVRAIEASLRHFDEEGTFPRICMFWTLLVLIYSFSSRAHFEVRGPLWTSGTPNIGWEKIQNAPSRGDCGCDNASGQLS